MWEGWKLISHPFFCNILLWFSYNHPKTIIMAKRKQISPEEHQKQMMESDIRDIKISIERGMRTKPPKHRIYKIGDSIQFGGHNQTNILEVFDNGMYYKVETISTDKKTGEVTKTQRIVEWHNLKPCNTNPTSFTKEEKYHIRMLNSGISSLLHMIHGHHAGVDFDVEYQREHVWKFDNKVALIDSIFNNIDIGKFVFVQRPMSFDGILYEIIDGKQRLSAIREFYEDRFKYRGFYFSELSRRDQNHFENFSISYGYLENPDKGAIFETFIKLNTCGKPMDKKHIDHVKNLLKELDE